MGNRIHRGGSRFFRVSLTTVIAAGALVALPALGGTAGASATTLYVATGGNDAGSCTAASPCATIQTAVNLANPGDTVNVAKGTYHQQVEIDKAINLVGAGSKKTIINGAGLDSQTPVDDPAYPVDQGGPTFNQFGVVQFGDTGGAASLTGFTITNPAPYAWTGGQPYAVSVYYGGPTDTVTISNDNITEGTADTGASTDFPIGIDVYPCPGTTLVHNNTISGFYQGALFEDDGPVSFNLNKVSGLIPGVQTSPTVIYPPEGAYFLADDSGTHPAQNATDNTFSGYAGIGIKIQGGYYTPGSPPSLQYGYISGTYANNIIRLSGIAGGVGILLDTPTGTSDTTATLTGNKGYVTSPDLSISSSAALGGTITLSQYGNNIKVHP